MSHNNNLMIEYIIMCIICLEFGIIIMPMHVLVDLA